MLRRPIETTRVTGNYAPADSPDVRGPGGCCEIPWLLKNSLTSISQKLLRVSKLYKRFPPVARTFSITRFSTFFRKTDFFNISNEVGLVKSV